MTLKNRTKNKNKTTFILKPLVAAIAANLFAVGVAAQENGALQMEEIIVTGSRRSENLQEVPINITAFSGDAIARNKLKKLKDIGYLTPGLTVIDQGPRDDSTDIIVRGLSTDALGPGFDAQTVATYIGDIPLQVDLKLNDMERVEVLLGPQGTLYGAGTLGGAIRYIPNRPQADEFTVEIHTELSATKESDDLSYTVGGVINIPLIDDVLAVRASLDLTEDSGFIDYVRIVRVPGVSNPNPDFTDGAAISANLGSADDVSGEEAIAGRVAIRWTPTDSFDATLTYHYQENDTEGRQLVQPTPLVPTGRYESSLRYEEPNKYENSLLSLEMSLDLGFATLVSATGITNYEEDGQRDQSDLLLDFEFGYGLHPEFAAFTRELVDEDTFTQELRLVSNSDGRLNWIVGAYYNKLEVDATSEEFAPGFDQWAIDNFGGVQLRPDSLEYFSIDEQKLTEKALFGEVTFDISDQWQVTAGVRLYEYEDELLSGFDLPLYYTVFDGRDPASIIPNFDQGTDEGDGELYKFNSSYDISDDLMVYFTYSEGFRLGGTNAIPECPANLDPAVQNVCGTPNELGFLPDTTKNYELGSKSILMDGRLQLNAAIYQIQWDDVRVSSTTTNGNLPIVKNASEAEVKGLEVSVKFLVNDNLAVFGNFSYTNAELSADAPGLYNDTDFLADGTPDPDPANNDGNAFDGDRLAGSPETTAVVGFNYNADVAGFVLDVNGFSAYTGDVITRTGLRANGVRLGGYTLHNLTATLSGEHWQLGAFASNLTNKYAVVSTRSNPSQNRVTGEGVALRSYGEYITTPRTIGVSLKYTF